MKETLIPFGEKILVRPRAKSNTTEMGIALPDSAIEKQDRAEIIEVGLDNETLKVGRDVIYSSHTGVPFTVNGERHLVLKFDDVQAVIIPQATNQKSK